MVFNGTWRMGSGKSLQAPGCQVHWHTHCELCAVCALHSLKTHCKYTRMQSTLYMFTLSLGVVAVRWLQPLLHTGIRLPGAGARVRRLHGVEHLPLLDECEC